MPRNMSFSKTTQQVRESFARKRQGIEPPLKDVTRRYGWPDAKPGTVLRAVEQGMGLPKGAKVVGMGLIRVIKNDAEPLERLIEDPEYGREEARREGFPQLDGAGFVAMFRRDLQGKRDQVPRRIEFEYL
jgi:hypothetical protein